MMTLLPAAQASNGGVTWASACTRRQLLLGAAARVAVGLKVARVWTEVDVTAPFMTAATIFSDLTVISRAVAT